MVTWKYNLYFSVAKLKYYLPWLLVLEFKWTKKFDMNNGTKVSLINWRYRLITLSNNYWLPVPVCSFTCINITHTGNCSHAWWSSGRKWQQLSDKISILHSHSKSKYNWDNKYKRQSYFFNPVTYQDWHEKYDKLLKNPN
jgi:hypothetical protein